MSAITKETLRGLLQAQILHNIIHDLNNPLGSISLIVELQQELIDPDDPDLSMLPRQQEQILNSIEKGSAIANAFQGFLSAGEEEEELFNLADNLRQLDVFASSSFRKLNSPLTFHIEDSMVNAVPQDINLLIFYLLFVLATASEDEAPIGIHLSGNTLQLKAANASLQSAFGSALPLPADAAEAIVNGLAEANHLDLSSETDTFLITFKNG